MSAALQAQGESTGESPPSPTVHRRLSKGHSWKGRSIALLQEDDKRQLVAEMLSSKEPAEIVGSGTFSNVYPKEYSGRKYAVKVDKGAAASLPAEREAVIGPLLDHPHIVRHHGCSKDYPQHLIMDFVEGDDLEEAVVKAHFSIKGQDEMQRRWCNCRAVGEQMRSALAYLHNEGYVYRDLKGSNVRVIIVDGKIDKATLIDLGMVRHIRTMNGLPPKEDQRDLPLFPSLMAMLEKAETTTSRSWLRALCCCRGKTQNKQKGLLELTICGSSATISPEMLEGIYTIKADSWSLGVLLYYIISEKYPFKGQNIMENLQNVQNQPLDLPEWLPVQAKDLLGQLINRVEEERPFVADIGEHPFFTDAKPEFKDRKFNRL